MSQWLIPILFVVVGVGLIISGIYYMLQEKDNKSSVRLYQKFVLVGIVISIGSIIYLFIR